METYNTMRSFFLVLRVVFAFVIEDKEVMFGHLKCYK